MGGWAGPCDEGMGQGKRMTPVLIKFFFWGPQHLRGPGGGCAVSLLVHTQLWRRVAH